MSNCTRGAVGLALGAVVCGSGSWAPARAFPGEDIPVSVRATANDGVLRLEAATQEEALTLELVPVGVRAPGFTAVVRGSGGDLRWTSPPTPLYRGRALELAGSRAAARFDAGRLTAVIVSDGGEASWTIEPSGAGHRLRRGVGGPGATPCPAGGTPGPVPERSSSSVVYTADLAVECDVEFFELHGADVSETIAAVETTVAVLNLIYEVEAGISHRLTRVIVWEQEPDPYTAALGQILLQQVINQWNAHYGSVPRDVAHLFTARALQNVGRAVPASVCTTSLAYGFSSGVTWADRVRVLAHELGHNWDAEHCEAYTGCWCGLMHASLGTSWRLGPCSIPEIRAFAASRACLDASGVWVAGLPTPFADDFESGVFDPARWESAVLAGVETGAAGEPSGAYAARVESSGAMTSVVVSPDFPLGPSVFLRYWVERPAGSAPLRVERYEGKTGRWVQVRVVDAGAVVPERFTEFEDELPTTLLDSEFRIRFAVPGGRGSYFIDDVSIGRVCRTDLNADLALSVADFGAFQAAFAVGAIPIADWNSDGMLTVQDFGAYQNSFAAGCY